MFNVIKQLVSFSNSTVNKQRNELNKENFLIAAIKINFCKALETQSRKRLKKQH